MSQRTIKIADRAVAILYFYAVEENSGTTLQQIISDFSSAGLGKPHSTKLRIAITKDKRTIKTSAHEWRLKSDKIAEVEKEFELSRCFQKIQTKPNVITSDGYVDKNRLQAIKKGHKSFDCSRLIQMLNELNYAYSVQNYISVILLTRAILDHVPPIFNFNTFTEVTSNYGAKSFKDSMSHLENSSRKIADSYLHTKIRSKESLPNKVQVNFSNDIDVLLAEIIRIS